MYQFANKKIAYDKHITWHVILWLEGSKLFSYVIAAMGKHVMNVTQVKIKS